MFASSLLLAATLAAAPTASSTPTPTSTSTATATSTATPTATPTSAAPAGASVGYVPGANPKAYRLTGDVVPSSFKLAFNVAPASGAYSGSEQIAVKLQKPTSEIVLHSVDIDILDARYAPEGGAPLVAKVVAHPESETVSLALPTPVPAGAGVVWLTFQAKLRDDLRGFYLVKAKDGTPYAFTQLEATDARRAFPCFDEPAYKATYDITVIAPRGNDAISNGPQLSGKWDPKSQTFTYVFATTPPISSYLVAVAVGRFDYVGPQLVGHTPIRVATLPGQQQLGQFALSMASELLPWYESYFGIPYPYAKLDLVAVPDFEAGAMENAGAIFFRDRDLLLDARNGSVQGQKLVAIVVAHEMAHQWFGDLVTMKWWDDVWLNEAFASLMENESVAALHPAWNIWDVFRAEAESAFHPDSFATTHPIHFDVATAEQANDAFDEITYIKGQACLRMLELYLAPKTWQAGIHDYLTAHAGGNAAEADLWQALAGASKQPVADIAKSWFEQPGYPLVTVKRAGAALQLSQQRFFFNPKEAAGTKALWQIPVCVKAAGGATSCELLTGKSGKLALPGRPRRKPEAEASDWFDANAEASGFYRVRYAPADLRALDAPMRAADAPTGLDAPEKIALVDDAWSLARGGAAPLAPALQLFADLSAERDATLAGDLEDDLDTLDHRLLEEKDRAAFSAYVEAIFAPAFAELKWDPMPSEVPDRHELRAKVIHALGVDARDAAVRAEAVKRVEAWEQDRTTLDPTLVGAVLAIVAHGGDAKRWDDFKARMDAANDPEDRDHFMGALAAFEDPALIQKSLELAISGGIRKQDVARFLGDLLDHRAATSAAWAFVKAHWTEVLGHATAQSLAGHLLPATGYLCTAADRQDVAAFFEAHKIESGGPPIAKALEEIDLCVRFKQQHKGELGKWLKARKPAAKATASR